MGACEFMVRAKGKTAREAFKSAVEDAQYESGHGGYTGTIAEKSDFRTFTLPQGKDAGDYAEDLMENDSRVSDKWGPAGCILLNTQETNVKEKVPQKATKAKVENIVQKGTRKWITYYVLYQNGKEVGKKEKKTEALERAKEIAIRTSVEVTINIEKRLEDGISKVAVVKVIEPKEKFINVKEEMNEYLFFGWASS